MSSEVCWGCKYPTECYHNESCPDWTPKAVPKFVYGDCVYIVDNNHILYTQAKGETCEIRKGIHLEMTAIGNYDADWVFATREEAELTLALKGVVK